MESEPTIELVLKLQLPVKTVKKLKAFAMLSGLGIDELEANLLSTIQPELAQHFDQTLSQGIAEKLSEMDGTQVKILVGGEAAEEEEPEHSLSGDDDSGETLSLAEQVEKDPILFQIPKTQAETSQKAVLPPQGKKASNSPSIPEQAPQEEFKFDLDIPEAVDDEQFIDSMFEGENRARPAVETHETLGAITPAGMFNPGKPRVRISEHMG